MKGIDVTVFWFLFLSQQGVKATYGHLGPDSNLKPVLSLSLS